MTEHDEHVLHVHRLYGTSNKHPLT